jgi:hypothetical protein
MPQAGTFTNRFNMPFIHFMGVVPVAKRAKNTTGSSMSTAFAFVSAENEESYTWALQAYENIVLYRDKNRFKPDPGVILRDGAEYIGHGVKAVFCDTPQLLCLFHVNRNVQTKVQETWRKWDDQTKGEQVQAQEMRDLAMSQWWKVIRSDTKAEFESRFNQLCNLYADKPNFVKYLRETQYPNCKLIIKC